VRTDSGDHDLVAARGEALFCVLISREHPTRGFLFDIPRHLGEKKRSVDYFVEVLESGDLLSYFFVQVKTTRRGYTRDGRRLKVRVSRSDIERLASYPAPAYVVGIDEVAERGYIVSVGSGTGGAFSSICTDYPLIPEILATLRDEVEAYWRSKDRSVFRSELADPRWREE